MVAGGSLPGMAHLDLRTVLELNDPTITLLDGTEVTAKSSIPGKLALTIRAMGVTNDSIERIIRGLFRPESAEVLMSRWESEELSISELNEMVRFIVSEVTGRPTTEPHGS